MDSTGENKRYGTDKQVTVAVKNPDAMQAIQITGIDPGTKYGVKVALRVRSAGKLFQTDPSEAIIVTTELPDGDFSSVEKDVTDYTATTNTKIANLGTKTTNVMNVVNTFSAKLDREFGAVTTTLNSVQTKSSLSISAFEKLVSGLTKNECVKRGLRYYGTQLALIRNIRTEQDCLRRCKQSNSQTGSIVLTINPSPNAGECRCLRERQGYLFDTDGFYVSMNRLCWDIGQADNAKWNSCIKFNTSHTGSQIARLRGTGSIKDCVQVCANRDGCEGVTYMRNTGHCLLKRAGTQGGALTDGDSVTLSCLA
jgi:hypothetical protein